MARYIKNIARALHSLGPSEERGYALWVGYDIDGVDEDLAYAGLKKVDEWPGGVTQITRIEAGDDAGRERLGIRRRQ